MFASTCLPLWPGSPKFTIYQAKEHSDVLKSPTSAKLHRLVEQRPVLATWCQWSGLSNKQARSAQLAITESGSTIRALLSFSLYHHDLEEWVRIDSSIAVVEPDFSKLQIISFFPTIKVNLIPMKILRIITISNFRSFRFFFRSSTALIQSCHAPRIMTNLCANRATLAVCSWLWRRIRHACNVLACKCASSYLRAYAAAFWCVVRTCSQRWNVAATSRELMRIRKLLATSNFGDQKETTLYFGRTRLIVLPL